MRNRINLLVCAGALGLALASSAQPFSNAVVALHPVAYYPLNETVAPPAAIPIAITNYGTGGHDLDADVTNIDMVFGMPGALAGEPSDSSDYFNSGTTYVQAAASTAVSVQPPFTIEGWFLADNTAATECPASDVDAASTTILNREGWLIYMDIANAGQYTFRTYNGNGTAASLSMNIGAAGSIVAGQWYHLAVVMSASSVTAYINGVLAASNAAPAYAPNDGQLGGLSIGARSDGGFGFEGQVDEFAFYAKALDAGTILSHYQAGTNTSPSTPYELLIAAQEPVVYYRMNESTPPLSSPYPEKLPIARNYGSMGAAANGFYSVGSQPGQVTGPTNSGLGGLPALELNPDNVESVGTSGPGVWADPFNPDAFNETGALTVTFWAQAIEGPAYFSSVLGRGDNSWRFDVDTGGLPHFAAAPNGDLVGPATVADDLWHFWAGVYDPSTKTGYLYIDGAVIASASWTTLNSDTRYPLLIGGVPDYWNGARNFVGNLAHVAIFTNALTQAQINSMYAAAGAPPTANILQTAVTINAGATLTIPASVGGSTPLSLQWYETANGTTTPVSGASSATLTLNNVAADQSGAQYFIVAQNSFGSVTSPIVTLTVVEGPPVLQTDVTPLSAQLPVGVSDRFSLSATGTEPFYFHWYANSNVVAGGTNSTFAFTVLPGTNYYYGVISNAFGATTSSVAMVIGITGAPPVISFASAATDWTTNAGSGSAFQAAFTPAGLELTDGNNGEASSAFYIYPQYIGGFTASFVYAESNGSAPLADGTTFCVQNDPLGAAAVGGGGGDLGFYGVTNSISYEINIYSGANGGVGFAYGTEGSTPDSPSATPPYGPTGSVNLASGDPIQVNIVYASGTMTVTLHDTVTQAGFTNSYPFGDITQILGSASGYVGFTGATGGLNSVQTVSDFQFQSTPPVAAGPVLSVASVNGSAVISWAVSGSSGLKLQSATAVNGPYADVSTTPTVVNGTNQVTVAETGTASFYRLGSK